MTGTIARDALLGNNPDIPVSVLKGPLNRIMRQTIALEQALEHHTIIPTDTPSPGANPEMSLSILQNGRHIIMCQAVVGSEADEFLPIIPTYSISFSPKP